MTPEVKREKIEVVASVLKAGISRACKLLSYNKSMFYYKRKTSDDGAVEVAIREAARFGDGFWKIYERLRKDGKPWNHKRVYRVYKRMRMNKRMRLWKRTGVRPMASSTPSRNPEARRKTHSLSALTEATAEACSTRICSDPSMTSGGKRKSGGMITT